MNFFMGFIVYVIGLLLTFYLLEKREYKNNVEELVCSSESLSIGKGLVVVMWPLTLLTIIIMYLFRME